MCRIWFIITHKYTDGYVAHGIIAYSTSMDSKPYRHSYGISCRVNGSRLKYWLNQPDTNLILIQGCMKSHTIFSNSIDFVAKSSKHSANLYVYNILQVYNIWWLWKLSGLSTIQKHFYWLLIFQIQIMSYYFIRNIYGIFEDGKIMGISICFSLKLLSSWVSISVIKII